MDLSIAQRHASCISLFHALAVSLRLQAVVQEDKTTTAEERQFEDAFDKFKLWASNSGAMHTDLQPNESLYHTLREIPFYRTPVLKLLQDLNAVLEATLALTNDEQSTHERDSITRSNTFTTEPPGFLEEHNPEEEDSPWEVSDSEYDDSPVLEHRTATSTGTHRTIPSTHSASVSEQLSLLESVGYIVSCLWKLPQRRPAPLDVKLQPSEEQSLDIMHVRDKFPAIDDRVAKRLGRLISRRRQSIHTRKIHEDALSKLRSATADSHQVEDQDSPYLSESASSVASKRTTRAARLKIPQRPRGDDGKYLRTFICPYCLITQSNLWERKWRRHVLSDLQPYVCTYPECALSEYAFRSRGEWFAHEQSHRPEWYCNEESHKSYDEQSKFFEHLNDVHEVQISETHRSILAHSFQRPSRLLSGRCNLCGEHSKKLKSHLSRHLEELFLFAIPKTDRSITSSTEKSQIDLAVHPGTSRSVPRYEQPTTSLNNRGEEPGPTEKSSFEVPVHLGTPKAAQTPEPSSIFSGPKFGGGREEYRWYCCACTYGGNSYRTDHGCANCSNHWRCQNCRVEQSRP